MFTLSEGNHPGSRKEHAPGHVHVIDSKGQKSEISLFDLSVSGTIDRSDYKFAAKWIKKNRGKLKRRFKNCMKGERPEPIDGLVERSK